MRFVYGFCGFSSDGRVFWYLPLGDGTHQLLIPPEGGYMPGVMYEIPVDECAEGLYDASGTLVAARDAPG
jgi:hypothetical protein